MHNGFVRVDNEKMSSRWAIFTVREILANYDRKLCVFIIRAQYRSGLNYSIITWMMRSRAHALVYGVEGLDARVVDVDWKNSRRTLSEAMNDDFNTPEAVAVLFELAKTEQITL